MRIISFITDRTRINAKQTTTMTVSTILVMALTTAVSMIQILMMMTSALKSTKITAVTTAWTATSTWNLSIKIIQTEPIHNVNRNSRERMQQEFEYHRQMQNERHTIEWNSMTLIRFHNTFERANAFSRLRQQQNQEQILMWQQCRRWDPLGTSQDPEQADTRNSTWLLVGTRLIHVILVG